MKYYQPIIIAVLILIIILQRQCTPKPEPVEVVKTDTIVTFDTVQLAGKVVYKPKPYAVYDTVHDTIFRTHKDTVEAVRDYSIVRAYKLPIIDTNGRIEVRLSVQYNKVSEWTYSGEIYNKQTVIERHHYVKELPKNKVFAGIQAGYLIPENNVILAPTIALLTKKDRLYSASYDPMNKAAQVGIYWKIRFK